MYFFYKNNIIAETNVGFRNDKFTKLALYTFYYLMKVLTENRYR